MDFQIVLLWTDALVYVLVALIAATIVYTRRHEHLRAPWARVAQSASGMVGLVVLAAFVAVGLLDSFHFRARVAGADPAKPVYAVEVQSVLDVVLAPLRAKREKTYSAPLAAHLYAKETLEQADGHQAREFPRLKFGGAHLKDVAAEWSADIARRAALGAEIGRAHV